MSYDKVSEYTTLPREGRFLLDRHNKTELINL